MDSPKRHRHVRPAKAFLDTLERRDDGRCEVTGALLLVWHHEPAKACSYELIDASPTGARLRVPGPLLEGMTGVAIVRDPGKVHMERALMVVWSRGIRDHSGRVTHHEAGIRVL